MNNSTLYPGIAGGAALGGFVLLSAPVTRLGWIGAARVLLALVTLLLSIQADKRQRPLPTESAYEARK